MNVLIACEESQRVCKEFRKKGHKAFSCDIQEPSGNKKEWHIKTDVLKIINGGEFITLTNKKYNIEKWDLIIAHPPCTYFSNATMVNLGRKDKPEVFNEEWKKNFFKKRQKALEFVKKIWESNCEKIAIENVVGYLNTHFQKPTQIIQPYYFGEKYKKTTCLWLKNLPKLEKTKVVKPTCKWVKHNLKNKNDLKGYKKKGVYNSKERAKTFKGIAKAMAEQWG